MSCRLSDVHLRRALSVAVLIVLLAVPGIPTAVASQPLTESAELQDPGGYADSELFEALSRVSLVDEWLAASEVSEQAALLRVFGSGEYETARAALVGQLASLADGYSSLRELEDRQARVNAEARAHSALVHELLDRSGEPQALDEAAIEAIVQELHDLTTRDDFGAGLGFSNDPLDLLEYRVRTLRFGAIAAANNALEAQRAGQPIALRSAHFGLLEAKLESLGHMIGSATDAVEARRSGVALIEQGIVDRFAGLHAHRALASTPISGLPVVTVDAYVRGAEGLAPGCSVDWRLLAGVGPVSYTHLTLPTTPYV